MSQSVELLVGGVKVPVTVNPDGSVSFVGNVSIPVSLVVKPEATPVPTDFYNLKTLGAKGDGTTDDTLSINNALAKCRADKKKLYVPSGRYLHRSTFTISGQEVYGDGDASEFIAGDPKSSAIYLVGNNPTLRTVKHTIDSTGVPRQSSGVATNIGIWSQTSWFNLDKVTINGGAQTGVMVYEATNGIIQNCKISNTLADTIHITNKSSAIVVKNNYIRNGGDDGIAVVSYLGDGSPCSNIQIINNDVGFTKWGRGISNVGGSDVTIADNKVESTAQAGVIIASEEGYKTFGSTRTNVLRNTITKACTNPSFDHPAILIIGRPSYPIATARIEANIINQPLWSAIKVDSAVQSILLKANVVSGFNRPGYSVIDIGGATPGQVTVQ